MTKLENELKSKYSFETIENLESWKTNALNKNKDNFYKDYIESVESSKIESQEFVDRFLLNSTDNIVARFYFLDEERDINLKYIVFNKNDFKTPLKNILVLKLIETDIEKIEKIFSKNLTKEEVVKTNEVVNSLLENKNTITNSKNELISKLNILLNKEFNIKTEVLDVKLEEIKTEITRNSSGLKNELTETFTTNFEDLRKSIELIKNEINTISKNITTILNKN